MKICLKCNRAFLTYRIINGKRRIFSHRKYCLVCSPFGIHNTKQLKREPNGGHCEVCNSVLLGKSVKFCSVKCKMVFYQKNEYYKNYDCRKRRERKIKCIKILGGKCKKCGFKGSPKQYDFHHLHDKDEGIANMLKMSWANIMKELSKCELLCANCHVILHHSSHLDTSWKVQYNEFKNRCIKNLGGRCIICGYNEKSAALSFHHLSGKKYNISELFRRRNDLIVEELGKCVLLCERCHRKELN